MPSYKHDIELIDTNLAELNDVVSKSTSPAQTIQRTNISLASVRNSKKYMTVTKIADVYHTTPRYRLPAPVTTKKALRQHLPGKKQDTPPVPAK